MKEKSKVFICPKCKVMMDTGWPQCPICGKNFTDEMMFDIIIIKAMNDIKKALQSSHPISSMEEIGFYHLAREIYTEYFVNPRKKIVLAWDTETGKFTTFVEANYGSIKSENKNE